LSKNETLKSVIKNDKIELAELIMMASGWHVRINIWLL
jgi:hypothetical protein